MKPVYQNRQLKLYFREFRACTIIDFFKEMIQTVKQNEQARQEYRLMSTFEMDARYKGFSEGLKQTAKNMKMEKLDISLIKKITGLSESEIEKL